MKKIKVKICDPHFGNKFYYGAFFLNILKKYYQVEFSENPDYIIYDESNYEYLKYDCVRIMFTGENITPNFNLCDYGVGFDYLTFGDRFFRLPLYLIAQFYTESEFELAGGLDFTNPKLFTKDDLVKKAGFCSFVYRNYLGDPKRQEMFYKLSEYKKVDSGGVYLNNIGHVIKSKLLFEMEHKFAIAFENSSRSGYTTEKLVNSLIAGTIPIYWGDPDVSRQFNQNRFINCHAYKNFDEVISRVKEIDQNDELYLKVINEPVAAPGVDFTLIKNNFEKFLCNIFDQPLSMAKRRTINAVRAANMAAGELIVYKAMRRQYSLKKVAAIFYRPFKQIALLEKFKQNFFAKKVHKK